MALRSGIALLGGLSVPERRLLQVLFNAVAVLVAIPEIGL